ncbi:MAG: D-alanyl-D-alanine carboxypeptidase family protein [Alphaproteobacteria bacterium]
MKFKLALVLAFSLLCMPVAQAQTTAPLDVAARQVYLVDTSTGTVLYAKDADSQMPTSSMSKMMTMYLVFDALKTGKLKMDDMLPVSEHAWKQEGSRMFLNVGQTAKVEDLIRGVIVQSGNDAAVTLAEALGSGSESAFAEMMNAKAKELGMNNSHFMNATGLPDPQHYSTARDLAILAMALQRDFPEHYHYFSELSFTYNSISQGNRNPLLYRNMNVDGLKTGHTDVGGYGLTASAIRDGRRVVMVLNGMDDMQARADESAKVLDYGYREFGLYPIAKAGDVMANLPVWLGTHPSVKIAAAQDAIVTLPRSARGGLKAVVTFDQPVAAPVSKGQQVGLLTITAPGLETKTIPLVATADVAQVGFFSRLYRKMRVIFGRKA